MIRWVQRLRRTGSVAPGKMGGHKAKAIAGGHRVWLLARVKERDFTLRGLVAEFGERGLKVDYRSVWNFVHAEKLIPPPDQSDLMMYGNPVMDLTMSGLCSR